MNIMTTETQQISRLFMDDYVHFESIHSKFPTEATAVFGRVNDLRLALQVFRESTNGSETLVESEPNTCQETISPVAEEAVLLESSSAAVADSGISAVLSSSVGSTEEEIRQIDAACAFVAPVAG
jgi:hypothetical protein